MLPFLEDMLKAGLVGRVPTVVPLAMSVAKLTQLPLKLCTSVPLSRTAAVIA